MSTTNAKTKADGAESASTDGLAAKLARAIFAVGDEPQAMGGPTQRIQFMGGHWPNGEREMGGLSEIALTLVIARALDANVELTGSGQVHRPESSDRRERG